MVWLTLGLLVLTVGAELLVRGAAGLAAAARIRPLVIGLTVVAFGTSTPELAVSVRATLAGSADIAVGNVVGSNIFNVLFILGMAAVITPLVVHLQLIRWDVPIMIGVSIGTWLLALNGSISRLEGTALFSLLIGYVVFLIIKGKEEDGTEVITSRSPWPLLVLYVIIGLVLLVIGSNWMVDGGTTIARHFGVSELVIGLTLVAAGTSLPELATSVVAAIRGQRDIAVGNIVGSNIFNLLAVIGLSAVFAPQGLNVSHTATTFDIPIMVATALVCLPIFFSGSVISRFEGGMFLLYYVAYVGVLILLESDNTWITNERAMFILLPATGAVLLASLASEWPFNLLTHHLPSDLNAAARASFLQARKVIILVLGGTVILAGVAMVVLPGPAIVVIPAGLAILATEFVWARQLLHRVKEGILSAANTVTHRHD
jgi:cation:H+ antiporter